MVLPTVIIWGTLLCLLRTRVEAEDWGIFVLPALLPLFLIAPVYQRYLSGRQPLKTRTPRYHFIVAALSAALGVLYLIDHSLHHRGSVDLLIHVVIGIGWIVVAVDHIRRARKARGGHTQNNERALT